MLRTAFPTTLDGRVLHEMRNVIASARDARRDDRSVPAISSPLLASRHAKKAPQPIVTPAPRPSVTPPVS